MTSRARVVVVSPDDATRAFVRLTLGEERYAVVSEGALDAAVRAVAQDPPEVLVLDGVLGGTVAALARTLRQQPETRAVRTLILVPRGEAAPEGDEGVDATLVVPATAFALLRKVDRLAGAAPGGATSATAGDRPGGAPS